MTKYEELGQAFDAWRKDYFEDYHSSSSFARWFCHRFKLYIGAPDEYIDDFNNRERKIKYIRLMSCTPNDDGVSYKIEETSKLSGFLYRAENGFYQFVLSIALESSPSTWPKQTFETLISFALQKEDCLIYVFNGADGVYKCKREQEETFHDAFDHIVSLLMDHLNKRQSERMADVVAEEPPPPPPTPMGFISFSSTPDGPPDDA